jgi:hypothetical protein
MKITPATGEEVSEVEGMSLTVKLLPDLNGGIAPVYYIASPCEDFGISIDSLRALVAGLELAADGVDSMITNLLSSFREAAMQEFHSLGLPEGPVEIDKIIQFISQLDHDDEEKE